MTQLVKRSESARLVRMIERGAHAYRLLVCDHANGKTPLGMYQGEPDDIIDEIEGRAIQQTNTLACATIFEVQAIDEDGNILSTEVFRLSPENNFGVGYTEPANEGGLLAQVMRHKEAIMRVAVGHTEKVIKQQFEMIDRLEKRQGRAEERHMQAIEMLEKTLLHDREMELEMKQAESKAKTREILASKVAALLPDVAAGVMGKLRGNSAASALLARDLFESINQEQFTVIMSALKPEQQQELLKLFKTLASDAEGSTDAQH